jgi:hypothetical protein
MGSGNQALVLATAARYGLTGREMAVLHAMAALMMDPDESNPREDKLYFGGWQYLTQAFNFTDPTSQDARRRVGRVLRSLVQKGALEHVSRGYDGHKARYRLAVTLTPSNVIPLVPVEKRGVKTTSLQVERGVKTTSREGGQNDPERGVKTTSRTSSTSTTTSKGQVSPNRTSASPPVEKRGVKTASLSQREVKTTSLPDAEELPQAVAAGMRWMAEQNAKRRALRARA